MAYIGNDPSFANLYVNKYTYTATEGQTIFPAVYDSEVDVYFNGAKLQKDVDYTATDGVTIVLSEAAVVGDVIDIQGYFNMENFDINEYGGELDFNLLQNKPDPNIEVVLSGDVSGSANTTLTDLANGSISIETIVADDSHNHVISNVDGLQSALDLKANQSTTYSKTEVDSAITNATPSFDTLTGKPTTVSGYGITDAYTKTETDSAIAGVVNSAPETLDTLNELAAALGDDPNFATTVANSIGTKQDASTALTTSSSFGGDVSGTYNAIVVADDSHNHVISNVDGLQDALDAKQPTGSYLTTSTSFSGDVSGTYNAIVVADDSHNHVISNVDGLQTALDEMASELVDASNLTTGTLPVDRVPYVGRRNLIINGAMQVAQRGTSRSFGESYNALDRWATGQYQQAGHEQVSVTDAAVPVKKAIRVTSSDATEAPVGSRIALTQMVESQNCDFLAGKQVTLSFWIRFSANTIAGTSSGFAFLLNEYDSVDPNLRTTGATRENGTWIANGSYPTIWTQYTKTITCASTMKNLGARFIFADLINTANSGDAWYEVTGVQLEAGSVATPFEHRSYGEELALCQRYYQYVARTRGSGNRDAGLNNCAFTHRIPEMRVVPTCSFVSVNNPYNWSNPQFINVTTSSVSVVVTIINTDAYWFYNDGYIADAEI